MFFITCYNTQRIEISAAVDSVTADWDILSFYEKENFYEKY